jgi:inorganic pyrophosphatase/exopolyphosphatase
MADKTKSRCVGTYLNSYFIELMKAERECTGFSFSDIIRIAIKQYFDQKNASDAGDCNKKATVL